MHGTIGLLTSRGPQSGTLFISHHTTPQFLLFMCVCVCSGLENLFHLTQRKTYELLVNMEDFSGNTVFARYTSFSIDPESDGYRLNVSGFINGGAGELLEAQVTLFFMIFSFHK